MKLFRILVTAMVAGTSFLPGPAGGTPGRLRSVESQALAAIDPIVRGGIADGLFPGAVLVAGRPGEVLWAKAYGRISWAADAAPVRLDTIYDLASVSKVAGTATASMVLLEDGRLTLDDRVSRYIPDFGAGKEAVTVRDLLTHVSGLKPYENVSVVEKQRRSDQSHADALIRHYAGLAPAYPPRQGERYSCLNMQTMARVIENCSGERMEDLLKRRVYGPLGMSDTGYVLSPSHKKRCAPTAIRADGSMLQGEVHDPLASYHGSVEHCPGNAGLFSTAPDLARLAEMILREGTLGGVRVFRPGTIRRMTSDHSPAALDGKRGLGWGIYTSDRWSTPLNSDAGSYLIGHTGFTGTFIWLDQRTRTYLVFLSNYTLPGGAHSGDDKRLTDIRWRLARAVMALSPDYQNYYRDQPLLSE